jgi:phosphopantothenoylcysteine synthetase/decarboxylase
MAFQELTNGDSGLSFRTKLNENFEEVYEGEGGGFIETLAFSGGTTSPASQTDPSVINTITHTFSESYSAAPKVVIIPKCDWIFYVSSVTTTQVVIGCGSTGSASTADYDLIVMKEKQSITLS